MSSFFGGSPKEKKTEPVEDVALKKQAALNISRARGSGLSRTDLSLMRQMSQTGLKQTLGA